MSGRGGGRGRQGEAKESKGGEPGRSIRELLRGVSEGRKIQHEGLQWGFQRRRLRHDIDKAATFDDLSRGSEGAVSIASRFRKPFECPIHLFVVKQMNLKGARLLMFCDSESLVRPSSWGAEARDGKEQRREGQVRLILDLCRQEDRSSNAN